ncbi:phage holin [Marinisporobacter balticus]|uniref:Putative membrane protein n=1 Tax=Marinisporobacter balticus TaxID=2018667 RepID=A0A4R2KGB4_9FIRM|nr:phage holin [Marinisporobacter balticus]TCO69486.1 putative membrane protein [Marinisporobacter balticus]
MNTKRLKNYGLWVAVAAFIPMLLEAFGLDVLPENYNEVVKALLGILVLLGIINNPTTNNPGLLDDQKVDAGA